MCVMGGGVAVGDGEVFVYSTRLHLDASNVIHSNNCKASINIIIAHSI